MPQTTKPLAQHWPLIVFTLSYLGAAVLGAVITGNQEFVFYIAVMFILIAIVTSIHLRTGLSTAALWSLSIWGMVHMAGGLVPVPETWPINGDIRVLYSLWIIPGYCKFDHAVHAYGFWITTCIIWSILRSTVRHNGDILKPTPGLMLLCAAASLGFGAVNEVVEFFATLLVPQTNVGGYINTGWDLVANTIGASGAAILIGIRNR